MNRKFLKLSLLSLCTVMSLIVGCGPQDAKDANYVTETADSDVIESSDKNEFGAAADAQAPAAASKPQGDKPEGCPVGAACPSGNCETPGDPDTHREVQLPDRTHTEPVKIAPTEERQLATDVVDYRTTHHIWQPSERHHTTHKHRNLIRRHFTKKVYHPTHRRINKVVRTFSSEDQVMPIEEEVAPIIDYGCDAPAPAPVVRPVIIRAIPPVIAHGFPYRY